MRPLLAVVTLLLTGLAAGTLFGVALANVPAFAVLPLRQYAGLHQVLDRYYEPTMPILVLVSCGADVALALATHGAARQALFTVAALALIGVAVVSQFANVPLLRPLRALDVAQIPPDWPDPRPAWRRWHLVRTGLACLALAAAASAVVI
jgi:Domain of unknown function (DUF1772)